MVAQSAKKRPIWSHWVSIVTIVTQVCSSISLTAFLSLFFWGDAHTCAISQIYSSLSERPKDINFPTLRRPKTRTHSEQCDQIGLFVKGLGHICSLAGVAQIFGNFLGYFKKCHFLSQNCNDYFFGYFGKMTRCSSFDAVWPDWAILGNKFSNKSSSNIRWRFAIVKIITF